MAPGSEPEGDVDPARDSQQRCSPVGFALVARGLVLRWVPAIGGHLTGRIQRNGSVVTLGRSDHTVAPVLSNQRHPVTGEIARCGCARRLRALRRRLLRDEPCPGQQGGRDERSEAGQTGSLRKHARSIARPRPVEPVGIRHWKRRRLPRRHHRSPEWPTRLRWQGCLSPPRPASRDKFRSRRHVRHRAHKECCSR